MHRVTHGIAEARVLDGHCHGFLARECAKRDPARFEERLTYMGTLYDASASSGGPAPGPSEEAMITCLAGTSLFALAARRALAGFLGCDDSREAVAAARTGALSRDGAGYVQGLLADQHVAGLIVDEGFPKVSRAAFQEEVGVPVYRAWRIETWFLERLGEAASFADFEEAFVAALRAAGADAQTVAFKTVVAFAAGLRVGNPRRDEVQRAYARWLESGQPLEGSDVSQVLHFLVRRTLEVAAETGHPVHIHTGAGDPFMTHIDGVQPRDLYPLLAEHRSQPVVLIHSGYPWLEEAAYVAAALPFVYVDVSAWQPWATLDLDRGLALLLGTVPTAKVLYGSDEASEPEILWLSARFFKAALSRVLDAAVSHDFLSEPQATAVAAGVLAGNTSRLHGLPN
jgi:predicted TIM-barrel fold metal-dependent hydrolase